MLNMLSKIFSRQHFVTSFSYFSQKIRIDISCKLSPSIGDNLHEMSIPVFLRKTKKSTILSSAELAQRVLNVNKI